MRGDNARARDRFLESLELKEKIGDLYDLAVAHNNLSEVSLVLGEKEHALDMARCALQFAEALAARDALPDIHRNYADALRAQAATWSPRSPRPSARSSSRSTPPDARTCRAQPARHLTQMAEGARRAGPRSTPPAGVRRRRHHPRPLERVPRALETAGLEFDAAAIRAKLTFGLG